MTGSRPTRIRRARLVPIALTTAALSSAVLGASVTGTLSAFNATITNSSNTATAGSLVMQETAQDGTTSCLSSTGDNNNTNASCSSINKYTSAGQADFVPGTTHVNTVTFANLGSSDATAFTLTPGACTPSTVTTTGDMSTANICDSLRLTLKCAPVGSGSSASSTVLSDVTLTSIAPVSGTPSPVTLPASCIPQKSSGSSVRFEFTLRLPGDQSNKVQGQSLGQPLTWTFTGATGA